MQNGTKSHGHILIKFLNMRGTKECKLFARNLEKTFNYKNYFENIKKKQRTLQHPHWR
jgi:hypothetical protein